MKGKKWRFQFHAEEKTIFPPFQQNQFAKDHWNNQIESLLELFYGINTILMKKSFKAVDAVVDVAVMVLFLVLDGFVGLVCETLSGCRYHQDSVRAQVGDDLVRVAVGRQGPFPRVDKKNTLETVV